MKQQYLIQTKEQEVPIVPITNFRKGYHGKGNGKGTETKKDIQYPSQFVDVDGTKIVYFRSLTGVGYKVVVVPGIVVSDEYLTEYNALVVDVEPITDSALRKRLEEMLKKDGYVNFWPAK